MKRKVPVTLNLKIEQIEELERLAYNTHQSLSDISRVAIDYYLKSRSSNQKEDTIYGQ